MFIIIALIVVIFVALVLYTKLTTGINKCSKHLVGKVVIVTGANTGIGYETACDLAKRGAKVILGCRNVEKGIIARDKIIDISGNNDVHFKHLDLNSFKSIRSFVDDVLQNEKQLDILINNAGMFGYHYKKTEDGLLEDMQTNHFGPFLLTSLLLPLLKANASSRILNITSILHRFGKIDFNNLNMENGDYNPWLAYFNSKLCVMLTTVELARRLQGTNVSINVISPGTVKTNILGVRWWAYLAKIFCPIAITPQEGAQTILYVAVSPELNGVSGQYFSDCRLRSTSGVVRDAKLAAKLWDISEKITKLK